MTEVEKLVVEVLSLFQSPVAMEALLVGTSQQHSKVLDAVEDLVNDSVIQRLFDPGHNDYTYSLLPIARFFIYRSNDNRFSRQQLEEEWKIGLKRATSKMPNNDWLFERYDRERGQQNLH
jgi:hypothetical protein